MSVTLEWQPFRDTQVDAYHVFRSITGFVIPFPNLMLPGAQLKFAATSSMLQCITFQATDQASVIAQINAQAKGIVATASQAQLPPNGCMNSSAYIFVRCTATADPKLKLYPCSALSQLGIQPGIIGPLQNFTDIGTVPFVDHERTYSFTDPDGANTDSYYLKTIKNLVYSLPTSTISPRLVPPQSCVIQGRVIDLDGNPIVGAVVSAQAAVQGGQERNAGINIDPVTVLTDNLGRWTITLPHRVLVQFVIPASGYNQVVVVPEYPASLFEHLRPVNDDAWDPSGFSAGIPFQIYDGVEDGPYGDY